MKIFKKIILEIILVFVVIFISGCDDILSKRPTADKYYGPMYGYAEEYGDVEVVLRQDGYYQVVDFAESAKQNNVLIIPDNINGIPVQGVGFECNGGTFDNAYDFNRKTTFINGDISYKCHYLYNFDYLPNGSIIYGVNEHNTLFYYPFHECNWGHFSSQYLYYYDYPQFNNLGTLDAIYINSTFISNLLPLLFLNYSETSKIIFNTTNIYYGLRGAALHTIGLLELIITNLDGDLTNMRDEQTGELLNIYKFDITKFKPKIILPKSDYNFYVNKTECDLLKNSLVPANIVYKYNKENPVFNGKYNEARDSKHNLLLDLNTTKRDYNEWCEKLKLAELEENKAKIDGINAQIRTKLNFIDKYQSYYDELELDNYWIDYNMDGDLLMEPPTPYLKGYEFLGWYKDAECTEKWSFDTDKVSFENDDAEIILYAKWNENKEE